jgi:bifunctional non-homologous end joining protein LigD
MRNHRSACVTLDPVFPSNLQPMSLRRIAEPFDDPDWLFELKYDGFRALAYLDPGRCRLVSRNGNEFKSFAGLTSEIAGAVPTLTAVLDGEIVCLDRRGGPRWGRLLAACSPTVPELRTGATCQCS